MARKKKDVESVVSSAKSKVTTLCPVCKSDSFIKVKDTEIGALYKCHPCGNRFQAEV
jgi:transposase-like protein